MDALGRLSAPSTLSGLNDQDAAGRSDFAALRQSFGARTTNVSALAANPGLGGQAGQAGVKKANQLLEKLQAIASQLDAWTAAHETARAAMRGAASHAAAVSGKIPDDYVLRQDANRGAMQLSTGCRQRRLVKRLAAPICAAWLAAALLGPPCRAQADTLITTQPYVESSGIPQLRAQGLDGSGIRIALIDGQVDPTVPELRGVDLQTKRVCPTTPGPASIAHATTVASILASPDYGWAPRATVVNYVVRLQGDQPDPSVNYEPARCADSVGYAINLALNDGAQVITISLGRNYMSDMYSDYALVRAAALGVPVIVAMGNDNQDEASTIAGSNLSVGVGAVDGTAQRASYSNFGTGLVVMAYGGPLTARHPDAAGDLTVIDDQAAGTSFAAPQVAGALALALQKWPHANGNQLIRVLIDTADGQADHMAAPLDDQMGYGLLNAPLLVTTDPSGYSSDNPLGAKDSWGRPSSKDIADYRDGLVDPALTPGDDSYVYRGCDPTILAELPDNAKAEPYTAPECASVSPPALSPAAPTTRAQDQAQATEPPAPTHSTPSWLFPAVGGAAVVLLMAAGLVAARTRRRARNAHTESTQTALLGASAVAPWSGQPPGRPPSANAPPPTPPVPPPSP